MKTRGLEDKKKLREYPTSVSEAFLFGGEPFFSADALIHYTNTTIKPIREVEYAASL